MGEAAGNPNQWRCGGDGVRIYLAARYREKNRMKQFQKELIERGHTVTSTWMNETYAPDVKMEDLSEDQMRYFANRDLDEIEESDVVFLFTVAPTTEIVRGGSIFEAGYAMGKGKKLLVIGPAQNIFLLLTVNKVSNWKGAKEWLSRQSNANNDH